MAIFLAFLRALITLSVFALTVVIVVTSSNCIPKASSMSTKVSEVKLRSPESHSEMTVVDFPSVLQIVFDYSLFFSWLRQFWQQALIVFASWQILSDLFAQEHLLLLLRSFL